MQLSVRQAALQAGVSRQTLFRYIKEGRISATISHTGEKQVEVSELLRVFGALQPETVATAPPRDRVRLSLGDKEVHATITYQIELERLRAQLEIKTAELDLAKERIAELKTREHSSTEEKNRLLTLVEQQSRLLSAPQPRSRTSVERAMPRKPATAKTKAALQPLKTAAVKKVNVQAKTTASAKASTKKVLPKAVVTEKRASVAAKNPSRALPKPVKEKKQRT